MAGSEAGALPWGLCPGSLPCCWRVPADAGQTQVRQSAAAAVFQRETANITHRATGPRGEEAQCETLLAPTAGERGLASPETLPRFPQALGVVSLAGPLPPG